MDDDDGTTGVEEGNQEKEENVDKYFARPGGLETPEAILFLF